MYEGRNHLIPASTEVIPNTIIMPEYLSSPIRTYLLVGYFNGRRTRGSTYTTSTIFSAPRFRYVEFVPLSTPLPAFYVNANTMELIMITHRMNNVNTFSFISLLFERRVGTAPTSLYWMYNEFLLTLPPQVKLFFPMYY